MNLSRPNLRKPAEGTRDPDHRAESEGQRAGRGRSLSRIQSRLAKTFLSDSPRNWWVLAVLTAGFVALLLSPSFRLLRVHYQVGEVADRNIKSPNELLLEDRPATERKKDEAERQVLSVFDYDPGLREKVEG